MKKKGFTLVELLAIIVILAIVALITVPTVLGVIEKTKKSALKDSAYGLIETANIYYAQYGVSKIARFDIENGVQNTEEENELSYKGNIKNGTLLINNKGKIMVCVNEDGYSAYKNYSQNEVIAVNKETCYIPENNSMVYLEQSGKTLSELTNQELTDKIEELENKINQLQQQLNNKTDSSSLNNLSVKHESDISNIWNKVGTEDISSLNGSISNTLINHDLLLQNVVTKDSVPGLSVNYASSAGSVEWGNVSGKPSTFTPSSHSHDDRYYTESEINSKLNEKQDASTAIKYAKTSINSITLDYNTPIKSSVSIPSNIAWEKVIAIIPIINGGYRDVIESSNVSYGNDGIGYFYITSHWIGTITTSYYAIILYVS